MSEVIKRQAEVMDEFSKVGGWEERYKKVIAMGKELPEIDEKYHDEKYLVKGCQSQVWLVAKKTTDGRVELIGDSDAMIVKGLVAILLKVYSNSTPVDILSNPPAFLEKLGFSSHLSPSRANGLMAMVKQIMMYAAALNALSQS